MRKEPQRLISSVGPNIGSDLGQVSVVVMGWGVEKGKGKKEGELRGVRRRIGYPIISKMCWISWLASLRSQI